jgi:hypothetical protein
MIRFKRLRTYLLLAVFSSLALPLSFTFPANTQAQVKPKTEEEVKVLFLGKWYDAEVIDAKGNEVLAEFVFISPKRQVFTREKVRLLNEVKAMDFSRKWTSANKSFTIDAALKRLVDDSVVLIKPDLREVTVPLEKLSSKDANYVRKIDRRRKRGVAQGLIPDIVPDLPDLETFDLNVSSQATFSGSTTASGKPLGGTPSFLKDFEQSGTAFSLLRKEQKLTAVIPVGGPDQLVLMTTRESNWRSGLFQSQAYWVSMKDSKVIAMVTLTPNCYPLDYDPKSNRLLTFHRQENDQSEEDFYTMWEMKPGASECVAVQRWQGGGLGWADSLFAKIIDKNHVVAKTDRNTYEGWDLGNKKTSYILKSASFFDASAVLTRSRKHLLFPEDKRVTVVDATSGDTVFSFPMTTGSCSGVNVNSSGTKLAALSRTSISVWDLESGSAEPIVYPAPLLGSPFDSRIEWIGDDYILGQSPSSRVLYQLSYQLPVWSYKIDVGNYWINRDPLKNMVVEDKIYYVARPETFGKTLAIGIVDLPGPQVAELTANIDRADLLALKKGSTVSLELKNISDEAAVRDWLGEKIKAAGWIIADDGEFKIAAEMGRGESRTVSYQAMGRANQSTSVTYRPYFASLAIKRGDSIIWSSGSSTGAPSVVDFKNAQSEINKMQVPQLNFFERVTLQTEVIDPKYARGFGVSSLGLRGISVVSTTPPGRADDPFAEAEKASEDQRKSLEDEKKKADEGEGNSVNNFGGE